MLDKLGKKGAAALGVGLLLIPMAKPDRGARTESGEVTLLGLSRADRLKGGPIMPTTIHKLRIDVKYSNDFG